MKKESNDRLFQDRRELKLKAEFERAQSEYLRVMIDDNVRKLLEFERLPPTDEKRFLFWFLTFIVAGVRPKTEPCRPPGNAEYLLYLFLPKADREVVIGDLLEEYQLILRRFRNKRRANIWFYKQVAGSLWPLLRQAIVKLGALVWLGRILRRLIS